MDWERGTRRQSCEWFQRGVMAEHGTKAICPHTASPHLLLKLEISQRLKVKQNQFSNWKAPWQKIVAATSAYLGLIPARHQSLVLHSYLSAIRQLLKIKTRTAWVSAGRCVWYTENTQKRKLYLSPHLPVVLASCSTASAWDLLFRKSKSTCTNEHHDRTTPFHFWSNGPFSKVRNQSLHLILYGACP